MTTLTEVIAKVKSLSAKEQLTLMALKLFTHAEAGIYNLPEAQSKFHTELDDSLILHIEKLPDYASLEIDDVISDNLLAQLSSFEGRMTLVKELLEHEIKSPEYKALTENFRYLIGADRRLSVALATVKESLQYYQEMIAKAEVQP